MAPTLDRAVEAREIVDALKLFRRNPGRCRHRHPRL